MTPIAAATWTFLGLLLALGGVACGLRAYVLTVQQHDDLPVWPWAHRQVDRLRALNPWRKRERPVAANLSSVAGVIATASAGSGTLTVGRPDETLEERVERLQMRIEQVAGWMIAEAGRATEAETKLSQRIEDQHAQLSTMDDQLRELATSVAVDTARLQICGLMLVGIGTALMAIPTIIAAFA